MTDLYPGKHYASGTRVSTRKNKEFLSTNPMKIGRVRAYSYLKGGGTIEPDNDSEEPLYFSTEVLKQSGLTGIQPGDRIGYEAGQDPDTPWKISVVRLYPADNFLVDLPF